MGKMADLEGDAFSCTEKDDREEMISEQLIKIEEGDVNIKQEPPSDFNEFPFVSTNEIDSHLKIKTESFADNLDNSDSSLSAEEEEMKQENHDDKSISNSNVIEIKPKYDGKKRKVHQCRECQKIFHCRGIFKKHLKI